MKFTVPFGENCPICGVKMNIIPSESYNFHCKCKNECFEGEWHLDIQSIGSYTIFGESILTIFKDNLKEVIEKVEYWKTDYRYIAEILEGV